MASREKSKQQKRQTREIKRLNLKIEILSEDLDEYQEVLCECDADYSIVVSVFLSFFKKKKAIQPQPVEKPEKDIETDVDRIKSPQWAKKLFKKIAKETHPDKLEHLSISNEQKAKKKKMYLDSLSSINDGDFFSLVDTAIKLGVDTEMSHDEIKKYLNKKIDSIENQIENIKSKFSWVWFHSDDATKIFIIQSTCKLYSISPSDEDIKKIMKAIKEKDLTVLTSRRSERKVGQRPPRIERK